MAISRMQQPRQMYGLGSIVKKATRAAKKIVKSPLGKIALGGALAFGLPGTQFGGLIGRGASSMFGSAPSIFGKSGGIGQLLPRLFANPTTSQMKLQGLEKGFFPNMFSNMNTGQKIFTGLGATALATPFLAGMGKDEEPEEEVEKQMDPAYQTQRARDYYTQTGTKGVGLDFQPDKEYVKKSFYAADGGRANYAMGGDAGNAQAEQMLMAEFVKYKNKGGDLSFEQFVQAVMQQQDQSQGMEQPTMMAANGGRIGYADGELVQNNMMMASDPSGDDDLNQTMEIFSIKLFGKELNDLTEDEYLNLQESLPDLISRSRGEKPMMAADGGMAGMTVPGYGTPAGTNKFGYPSGGVRVNAAEGGIMDTDEASEMIDMGGQEKDYRDEGGFVAMGGEERADDVPARLSKNEFVFTADAVRNAGGGDIDRGSEVMQNLMDNLEQGGQVSEDSQGLGGGEEMMSEEIIEEPNGAQAMYEQQQALQSRMA